MDKSSSLSQRCDLTSDGGYYPENKPSDTISEYKVFPIIHKNMREVQHPDLVLVQGNCNHEDPRHSEEQSISTSTILNPFGLLQQIYNLHFKGPCVCNDELNNNIKIKES